ncbi:MAG: type II toxin-antitoxin system RelE/ParE family toxin [Deltaproteobacteria bacterium]|nr:type II toxin-antitoxin system RelE/ParE family toxin [Deltaproteobacteria bacterium]
MKVFQSSSFSKKVKKFKKNKKEKLDTAVKEIIETPSIGVEKKGDLRGIFVHKFKIQKTLYLLSYRLIEQNLELIMIGAHENYYKDLKSYLKNR